MRLIEEHIQNHLYSFNDTSELFEKIFNDLKSGNKDGYQDFLNYIYCILEKKINVENDLNVLNIHFEKVLNDIEKTLIAEFLWRYFFEKHYLNNQNTEDNYILLREIENLRNRTLRDLILPSISPMMTTFERTEVRRITNELREERKIDRLKLKFYENLNSTTTLNPTTLFNLKINQEQSLKDLFEYNPAYLSVENLSDLKSYVLNNIRSFNDVRTIRINNEPLLKIVENIILFDCENSVQRFLEFNFQQLSNLNQNHGTKFKSFIPITFSKKESLNSTFSKINKLNERYFIQNGNNYIISRVESELLINDNYRKNPDVIFIAPSTSTFWDDFLDEVKINGLYELRSIKLKNIYNLCFNEEIKESFLNKTHYLIYF